MSVFYESYGQHKSYRTPDLKPKHIARFDREFWEPAACKPEHQVLEIGCGEGHFLHYLHHKGAASIRGVDLDPKLAEVIPEPVRDRFIARDVRFWLKETDETFDRMALFDVLEHFTPDEGLALLKGLAEKLSDGGRLVVKVPNAGSPWGQEFQHGDLTHLTGYTPTSMRQLAVAAGLKPLLVYPHLLGSPLRQLTDRLVHGVLGRMVMTPPEIWTGNFFAVLEKPGS